MNTTFFYDRYGRTNSVRVGNKKFRMSTYLNRNSGGTTFRSKYGVTRVDKTGRITGIGIRAGSRMSYFSTGGTCRSYLKGY